MTESEKKLWSRYGTNSSAGLRVGRGHEEWLPMGPTLLRENGMQALGKCSGANPKHNEEMGSPSGKHCFPGHPY